VQQTKQAREALAKRFWRWYYMFQDYEKFLKSIKIIRAFQRNYRVKRLMRKFRIYKQKQVMLKELWDMIMQRMKFKDTIRRVVFAQKTLRFFRFLKLIRFAKAIKEILWEHFDHVVWKEIHERIRERAAIKIQKVGRGYIVRKKYKQEVAHMREFRSNLYQNFSAKKIQKHYRGYIVRTKILRATASSVKIQKVWKGFTKRVVYRQLRKATVLIQSFWRVYSFSRYRFSDQSAKEDVRPQLLFARIDAGERAHLSGLNFVEDMPTKDRKLRFAHKRDTGLSFVEGTQSSPGKTSYSLRDGKISFFGYLLDVESLVDPQSLESPLWSTGFCECYGKMRRLQKKNQMLFVFAGDNHAVMAGNRGSLFQWGGSDLFQLGFPKSSRSESMSLPRKALAHLQEVSAVQTGFSHTLAYSKASNRLLAWGDNSHGQLGTGSFQPTRNFVDLTSLIKPNTSVACIFARADASAVILSDGSSYIWPHLQSDGSLLSTPIYAAFDKEKVVSIGLGLDFSVFLVSDGSLYSMGRSNRWGELGHGDREPRFAPMKIQALAKQGVL